MQSRVTGLAPSLFLVKPSLCEDGFTLFHRIRPGGPAGERAFPFWFAPLKINKKEVLPFFIVIVERKSILVADLSGNGQAESCLL
jgi:hypothetical protein